MWYIYMLIGLYLITIPMRQVVKYSSKKQIEILLFILVMGNFVIQTINTALSLELENYMQWNHYITINEQILKFAQNYPTSFKTASSDAPFFMNWCRLPIRSVLT